MIGYGPILIQFSMVHFQTLHTIGKHIEVFAFGVSMKMKSILTELSSVKLSLDSFLAL